MDEKDQEIEDLKADLELARARIRNYQDTVESLEAAIKVKDSFNEGLRAELASYQNECMKEAA